LTGIPEPPAKSGNPVARDAPDPPLHEHARLPWVPRPITALPAPAAWRCRPENPKYRDVYDLDAIGVSGHNSNIAEVERLTDAVEKVDL